MHRLMHNNLCMTLLPPLPAASPSAANGASSEYIMAKPASQKAPEPAQAKAEIHDAFIVEKYEQNGEEKRKWHEVGTAFPSKSGKGLNLYITPGLSVSGQIVIVPRTERTGAEEQGH